MDELDSVGLNMTEAPENPGRFTLFRASLSIFDRFTRS